MICMHVGNYVYADVMFGLCCLYVQTCDHFADAYFVYVHETSANGNAQAVCMVVCAYLWGCRFEYASVYTAFILCIPGRVLLCLVQNHYELFEKRNKGRSLGFCEKCSPHRYSEMFRCKGGWICFTVDSIDTWDNICMHYIF